MSGNLRSTFFPVLSDILMQSFWRGKNTKIERIISGFNLKNNFEKNEKNL